MISLVPRLILPGLWLGWLCASAGGASPSPVPEGVRGVNEMSAAQRYVFLKGCLTDWRGDTDDRKGVDAPPLQKPYPADAKRIPLVKPEAFKVGNKPVIDAIRDRRSLRNFADKALTLEELSYLLWATQGISKIDRDSKGKVVAQFRTVPSGGARHPFETYLLINKVEGVAPGLYRYLPVEHQLLLIREDGGLARQVVPACYGQAFTGEAPVVFVWTAIPYRTEWHYGCISQKLVAIEAGHVGQNLYLAADSIGGGVCTLLGYSQNRMDTLIGVDGKDEFVIYMAAAGKQP